MWQNRRMISVVILISIFLVSGCAAANQPAISTGDSSASTDSVASTDAALAEDQTLTLASGRDLGPVNPHTYDSSMVMLDLVYEPLVRYGVDGSIQPALAESWSISEDGLTWTFNLRDGVTFHDGTPFDAEVAKWNMERWVGDENHIWLPTAARVTDIAAPDDSTLVLTLNEAYYPGIQDLTLIRPVRFLSPTGVDGEGNFVEPIGTGPWQIDELADDRAVLTRYENYWGEKPKLDKLVVEVVLDAQTRIAALLSGELDIIGGEYLGSIAPESMSVLERDEDIVIDTAEGITDFYISTKFEEAPMNDPLVREAINHAIDREGIASAIFDGQAEPANGLCPPSIPYVSETVHDTYSYDPELAGELLAEAGWTLGDDGVLAKDGERLAIDLVVDQSRLPQTASVATAIQSQLSDIGIDVELRLYDYSGWLEAYNDRDFDMLFRFTWGPPYDPHTILSGEFYGSEGGTSYSNPELDQLVETVLSTTDEAERQELYDQIWDIIDSQAAIIPIVYPQRVYAHRAEVDGFRMGGTEYDLAYAVQNVSITE